MQKVKVVINQTVRRYNVSHRGIKFSSATNVIGVGKSAYDIYKETTTDNPILNESDWIDSLYGQDGVTPTIGANGNWFIGNKDTGTVASNGNVVPEKPYFNVPMKCPIPYVGLESEIEDGWSLCDGRNVVGYGLVPDMRGRFIVGADPRTASIPTNSDTNLKNYGTAGNTGGKDNVQLAITELPEHSFKTVISGSNDESPLRNNPNASIVDIRDDRSDGNSDYSLDGKVGTPTLGKTNTVGDDQPHENRPPYYVVAFIIRTTYQNAISGLSAYHTGDATGSTALTLATVNSNIGTFNNVTINAKGLATAGSNVSYLTGITSGQVTTALGYTPVNTTDSRLSDARSAIDVYDWAKQSTKPSYNWSEIGSKPTLLSSFINDLGNYGNFVTGTPWTSQGYITNSALNNYLPLTGGNLSGNLTTKGLTITNGTKTVNLVVDANGYLSIDNNLYSSGEISAFGVGTGSGGSGGLIQTVYGYSNLGGSFNNATLTDTFNAYTINAMNNRLINVENGALTQISSALVTNALGYVPLPTRTFGTAANNNTSDFYAAGSTVANSSLLEGHNAAYFQVAGSYAPASGSSSYIQNQNSSAQSANMWISGHPKFGDGSVSSGKMVNYSYNGSGILFNNSQTSNANVRNFSIQSDNKVYGDLAIKVSSTQGGIPDLNLLLFGYDKSATFSSTVNSTGFLLNGNNLTSSLSTNYLPKWNGSSMVNSLISDDGNKIYVSKVFQLNDNYQIQWGNSTSMIYGNGTNGTINLTGNISVANGTVSTSPTTGALVVNGGIGSVGMNVKVTGNSDSKAVGSVANTGLNVLSGNGLYGLFTGISNSGDVWAQVGRNDGGTDLYSLKLQPNGGNVEIGYTADQGYKLAVNGAGYFNGNVTATGEITAYSTSDIRLKENIQPLNKSLELINKLNPVQYNWNDKAKELNPNKTDKTDVGVIAQELKEVLPNLVHGIYNDEFLSVDYVKLIPYLIGAIQELTTEINSLKNK